MKKTIITYFVYGMIVALLATSCYDDKSTSGTITDRVEIDTTGWNVGNRIDVANGSTLRLSPKVTPADNPNLSYEWKITITSNGNDTNFSRLSEQKDLERVVTQPPSSRPYTLVFTVTDNRNGVAYIHSYQLYVSSRMGDGILVADTRDDATSDITLVRNRHVSSDYSDETQYIRDSYSFSNGQKMEGVMRSLLYGPIGMRDQAFYVTAMTDKTLENLDASTHRVVQNFEQMFTFAPARDKEFQTLASNTRSIIFVYGGDIYGQTRQTYITTATFGDPYNYVSPAQIANKRYGNAWLQTNGDLGSPFFFDTTRGAFYYMEPPGYTISGTTAGTGASTNFDPNSLQGYTLVGSSRGEVVSRSPMHHRLYFLLKDPAGSIDFYRMHAQYIPEDGGYLYESDGKYAASACPDIENALFFEGSVRRSVVYYGTRSAVYPCVIGGSAATVNQAGVFTAPAGEEITAMKLFRDARCYFSDNVTDAGAEDGNQMLVATYNTSTREGKVYVLPITGNSGSLGAPDAEGTFTGFGRVTALGMQGRQ